MQDTNITILGYVGTDPVERQAGGATVVQFRLASTPRNFSPKKGEWVDRETNWFTVNAWRSLGRHCMSSLHRGDPVIVHGRLQTQAWLDAQDQKRTTMVVEAQTIGHDLRWGTSAFLKDDTKSAPEPTQEEQELAQGNHALEQVDGAASPFGDLPEVERETVSAEAPF